MFVIRKEPNPSGAYPPMQTWSGKTVPEGCAIWPDELDTATFYEYNGFVTLTIEQAEGLDVVTGCEPSTEAWEEWKASLPDPAETVEEASQMDKLEAQVTYTAMMTDTLLEV